MRKIYTGLCATLLAVLLLVGLISSFDKDEWYSDKEQRSLATMPKLTVSGLLDGSFYENLQIYYSDTFPGRENMLDTFEIMDRFYTFGGDGPEPTQDNDK